MITFEVGLKFKIKWTLVGRLADDAVPSLVVAFLALCIGLIHAEFDIAFAVGVDPHFHNGLLRGPDSPCGPPFASIQLAAILRGGASGIAKIVIQLEFLGGSPTLGRDVAANAGRPPDGVS